MNTLITYINTKLLIKAINSPRLEEKDGWIYIHKNQLEKRFQTDRSQIEQLAAQQAIAYREDKYNYWFMPLKSGAIDLSLVYKKVELSSLHETIRANLLRCDLPEGFNLPKKLNIFFTHRHKYIDLFFVVDRFSGRIHSPISRMSKNKRELLLIDKEPVCAIDVATMQPLVLGKLLFSLIGANDFSNWINQGEDIYSMLQKKTGIEDREEAKKLYYKIAYGKSDKELIKYFGHANWINAIRTIKSKKLEENPHNEEKPHSNLSWLLQKLEVNVMSKIWAKLVNRNIPFLTVHDEIICKESDLAQAEEIFHDVLSNEYDFYSIKTTRKTDSTKSNIELSDIENLKLFFDDFDYSRSPKYFSDGCKLANPKDAIEGYLAKVQDNYMNKGFNQSLTRLIDFIDLANV